MLFPRFTKVCLAASAVLFFSTAQAATAGDIVITEIMQNPSAVSDSNGEWFEVFNQSTQTIDMNGWTIRDAGGDSHTINQSVIVASGAYVVFGRNSNSSTNGGISVAYQYSGISLANGADEIILTDASGQFVDEAIYDGGSSWPDPTGASMVLSTVLVDNNVGGNWSTSTETLPSGDEGTPGSGPDTVSGGSGGSGGTGGIVITEVMQNPSAVSDSRGEWFEVLNTGSVVINLNGWTIRDDGSDSHVITSDVFVSPGAFVVLGRNDNTSQNGGITMGYEYSGITLSNGADEVVLEDTNGTIMDQVSYDGGSSWPDPTGASMELNNPDNDNDDGSNWAAATDTLPSGDEATPGSGPTGSGGGGSGGGGGGTPPTAGSFNVYFGNTHAHTEYSDGNKANDTNFLDAATSHRYARDVGGLDWIIMSDHNHSTAGMVIGDYQLGVSQTATVDAESSSFTALYGMEWGTISSGGHIITVSDNLWGWEAGNFDVFTAKGDYNSVFNRANLENTFIELCHPNTGDFDNIFNIAYNATWDNAISLIAVKSGPAFAQETDFSNPSSSNRQTRYFDLLLKGYHLAPTGDQDTHFANWGLANQQRTAVLASDNSRAGILEGLKAGRTYATEDRNVVVVFTATVGAQLFDMADTITVSVGTTVEFGVQLTDPDGETILEIELLQGTVGGSAVTAAVTVPSDILNHSFTPTSTGTTFFLVRATELDTQRVWTAPIWVVATP